MTMDKKDVEPTAKTSRHLFEKDYKFNVTEFIKYDRTLSWYVLAFGIFCAVVIIAILLKDIYLAGIIILGSVVWYQFATVDPKKIPVALSRAGIEYRKKMYPWETFESFSIFGEGKDKIIYLYRMSMFAGPIIIPLPELTSPSKENDGGMFVEIVKSILPQKVRSRRILGDFLTKVTKF